MLTLKSDAWLKAEFNALMQKIRIENHAKPYTPARKAAAKSLLLKARKITAEMSRRAGVDLAIVAAIDGASNQIKSAASGAVGLVSGLGNKLLMGLALVGFVVYQFKK